MENSATRIQRFRESVRVLRVPFSTSAAWAREVLVAADQDDEAGADAHARARGGQGGTPARDRGLVRGESARAGQFLCSDLPSRFTATATVTCWLSKFGCPKFAVPVH